MFKIVAYFPKTGEKITLLEQDEMDLNHASSIYQNSMANHLGSGSESLHVMVDFYQNNEPKGGFNLGKESYNQLLSYISAASLLKGNIVPVHPSPIEADVNHQSGSLSKISSSRRKKATDNAAVFYLDSKKTESTRYNHESMLNIIAKYYKADSYEDLYWGELRYTSVLEFIAENKHLSSSRKNSFISIFKGVAKQAKKLKQMSLEDYHNIDDIESFKVDKNINDRYVSPKERDLIIEYLVELNTVSSARDLAMFALAIGSGLRRSEVTKIKINTIQAFDDSFQVIGKGDKSRIVPLPSWSNRIIIDWLDIRVQSDSKTDEYLFCGVTKDEELILRGKPLSEKAFENIVTKIWKDLKLKKIKCHDLRAAFATYALYEQVDLKTVANAMGHSSTDTTGVYDRRETKHMIDSFNSLE